ncbi:serine hydrolase [Aggregatilinea lenta]|uniref:serine hydrolase n=1 Tax=Aggregatilinea lenta TaxID=913108 RepID=UPI000E5A15C9|nr:serine hydrolase [Aggregatilinea lenta]
MRLRSLWLCIAILLVVGISALVVPRSGAQDSTPTAAPNVYVEAIERANLRSGPGVNYPVVGDIGAGAYYQALARHEFVPWLQIDYPGAAVAWVYNDLVTITGNIYTLPIVSDYPPVVSLTPTPLIVRTATPTGQAPLTTPAASPTTTANAAPDTTDTAVAAPSDTPAPTAASIESAGGPPERTEPPASPTATIAGPIATILAGPTNVRYGPGIDYPPIVELDEGGAYPVTGLHAMVPWVEIALPESATGRGWVYRDLVEIGGDTSQVPVISSFDFNLPDLTPTPQTVVVNAPPWDTVQVAPGTLAESLGEQMNGYLLEQGFDPYAHEFGSVFLLDLRTGDTFTLNDGVAYSGMSLTKIPILTAYFQQHEGPLGTDDAFLVADTMMCSENLTTNALLEDIGDGDGVTGAQRVTALMQNLGLRSTFIMAPYVTSENEERPNVGTVQTNVDQVRAEPDPFNQTTPKDLGWLLAGIYQCAMDGSGLLTETYPDDFTVQECRQMLSAMDANVINVFIEAGVPEDATVIHKHGWVDNTHGDAGIVIGPDDAYVLVAVLHSDEWLPFENTSPTIAELSRLAWNTLNPTEPVAEIHPGTVPDLCNPREDPVMDVLLASDLPAPGPVFAATTAPAVTESPPDTALSPTPGVTRTPVSTAAADDAIPAG